MKKLLLMVALLYGCKASEINSNLEKIASREPIEVTKIYSRQREVLYRKYQEQLRFFKTQIVNDSSCGKLKTAIPPEVLIVRPDMIFNPPPISGNGETQGLTSMLTETRKLIKDIHTYVDSLAKFQIHLSKEDNEYLKRVNIYNEQMVRYYNGIIEELKYATCKANNDLKRQQIKTLEHELELTRIQVLVKFRPNPLQRLFNSQRNKKYKAIGGFRKEYQYTLSPQSSN